MNTLDEIARLTAALHANRCHPDYVYIIVPRDSLVRPAPPEWEECDAVDVAPGDVCLMRRRTEDV